MPNINDRIGSQNVIRVLSNSTAPPIRLIDLSDVNSDIRDDGMILVWDLPTQTFIMTSVTDSASSTWLGIGYFENETDSFSTDTGAVVVSGGVGIGSNLNVGGITTFFGPENREEIAVTLAANGGITTTGGDLFVGGDLVIDNLGVGSLTVRDGVYYVPPNFEGPNGIAFFGDDGRINSGLSTENAIETTTYILTVNPNPEPNQPEVVWSSEIDGGFF